MTAYEIPILKRFTCFLPKVLFVEESDIGETSNLATGHLEVVQQLLELAATAPQTYDSTKLTYINPPAP